MPRGVIDSARAAAIVTTLPGSADRLCANIPRSEFADDQAHALAAGPRTSSIRTGDFVVGAEIGSLMAGRAQKVYWVTLHEPRGSGIELVVRAARLGPDATPGDTVRFTQSRISVLIPSYPTAFSLPSPGKWLVVATSGPDWGCMIMPVG